MTGRELSCEIERERVHVSQPWESRARTLSQHYKLDPRCWLGMLVNGQSSTTAGRNQENDERPTTVSPINLDSRLILDSLSISR